METINLRFTLDANYCTIEEYLDNGLCAEYFHDDQTFRIIVKDVDETLVESLHCDELAEFFGIESEFVIAIEVI